MGSYLHVGLVLDASVDASQLKANGTTEEQLGLWLQKHRIDPDKFEQLEVDGRIKWRLKDRFAGAPLVAFLQEQDGISELRDSKEHQREELYQELRELQSWDAVLALAQEGRFYDFYRFDDTRILETSRGRWGTRLDITLLVFLSEGKAIMECWNTLFCYLEHMIHLQSERFPIASAVKLAIG